MLPNTLPAQSNGHHHHRGSCYPTGNDAFSPKIHAEGDGLEVFLFFSWHIHCTCLILKLSFSGSEYQLRAVLFLIIFSSKNWETNQTFLYQYKCRSENLIQAFTRGFGGCDFSPTGLSISYLKKICYVGQSIFSHVCYYQYTYCYLLLLFIYQNADSGEGSVLKATCYLPSISKLIYIMTTLFPPTCQY